jgi:hypothetical protein
MSSSVGTSSLILAKEAAKSLWPCLKILMSASELNSFYEIIINAELKKK